MQSTEAAERGRPARSPHAGLVRLRMSGHWARGARTERQVYRKELTSTVTEPASPASTEPVSLYKSEGWRLLWDQ